jgi:polar amino acid transport system substrate-binding protein
MRRVCLMLLALTLYAGAVLAQSEGLAALRQQGYVRVCADPANLPFTSNDAATPGFEVELARLIARELGVEARLEWHATFARALRPLRTGGCDLFMGLPAEAHFTEANPWISVSRPYYTMGHAMVVKAATGIATLDDLKGKRVAVDATSVADFYLFDQGLERGIYRGQEAAFRAVVTDEAAAALLWLPVANWLARHDATLRVIPLAEARLEFPIGAGVRRRDRDLAAAVDQALERLQSSGEAQAVLEHYGAVARPGALPTSQAPVPTPVPGANEAGRVLFSNACSRCHGAEGVGSGMGGAVPAIRHYDGGQEKFLRIVQNGKKGTPMGPFKGILTVEEILNIYHYLTSLPRQ